MKRTGTAFAVALLCAYVLSLATASAQEQRDPLISPPEGDLGSRFQIVGQVGWTPGETVTISVAFTTGDPLRYPGPFPFVRQATVLRDGTWSFPVNVNDSLSPTPLDGTPGYIVVKAQSPTKTAVNAFIFSPGGHRPAGLPPLASFGFGPQDASPVFALTAALFAAATGALLVVSGACRRSGARTGRSP